jgi:hypothetical protein
MLSIIEVISKILNLAILANFLHSLFSLLMPLLITTHSYSVDPFLVAKLKVVNFDH